MESSPQTCEEHRGGGEEVRMNENYSGTMGLGDGVMKEDQSDPAVSEPRTTSFAPFWEEKEPIQMREHLEQDLRSSPEHVHGNGVNGNVQQLRAALFGV